MVLPLFVFQKKPVHNGLIRTVIIIVIAIIVLGALGINLRGIVESPLVQENFQYAWSIVESVWDRYLEEPVMYVWETFLEPLLRGESSAIVPDVPTVPGE